MGACTLEYEWPTHVIASLVSLLGGVVILLPARLLWNACQAPRRALLSGQHECTQDIFAVVRNTAIKILSGNTTFSKVVILVFYMADLAALAVYLVEATYADLVVKDVCSRIQDDPIFIGWVSVMGVTFIHFIIRFLAAPDKAVMWVSPYSIMDHFSIVPTAVNLYYNRYWLAFGFMRPLCLIRSVAVLQTIHVIKDSDTVKIIRGLAVLFAMWLLAAGFFHLAENNGDPVSGYSNGQLLRYWECFYYVQVTMCTIGYGDITPVTSIARMFFVLLVLGAMAVFSTVIPQLGFALANKRNKYGSPYQRTYGKGHLIICGGLTFDNVSTIVRNVISKKAAIENTELVIVNNEKPSTELQGFFRRHFNDVTFIEGSILNISALGKAKTQQAVGVLILADRGALDEDEEDTSNILRATAIKNFSPHTRVIVQLLQQHNKNKLFNIPSWSWHAVGGDEIICISELKMGFMAQNCLAPGIVTLLSNLLYMRQLKPTGEGGWMDDYLKGANQEIYTGPFSQAFYGLSFVDAAEVCYNQFGVLLLAVNTVDVGGRITLRVNPGNKFIIQDMHIGFFIARCQSQVYKISVWQSGVKSMMSGQMPSSPSTQYLVPVRSGDHVTFKEPVSESASEEELLEFMGGVGGDRAAARRARLSDDSSSRPHRIMPPHSLTADLKPEQFNHTGRVHWCQARELKNVLLDEETIRDRQFSDHIILVLRTHGCSDAVALTNFLTPLRSSSIHSTDLKTVVIHVDPEWIARVWKSIANFPSIFVYTPSKSMHADLRSLKIQRCSMCLVMSSTEKSKVDDLSVDRHVILATMNILNLLKLEEKINKIGVLTNPEMFRKQVIVNTDIPLLIVLEHDSSVAYMNEEGSESMSAGIYSTAYVSGRVLLSSTLDSLVTTAYVNTQVLMLIRALITGGESSDFEKILAEDVGIVRKTTLNDVTNARRRSVFSLLSLNHGVLEKINHQYQYGQLMKWALRSHGMLCLGLYRLINPQNKDPRHAKRFVITNPASNFRLLPSDKVYVLKPFEIFNKTRHLSLSDPDQSDEPMSFLAPSQSPNQLSLLINSQTTGRVPRSASSNQLSRVPRSASSNQLSPLAKHTKDFQNPFNKFATQKSFDSSLERIPQNKSFETVSTVEFNSKERNNNNIIKNSSSSNMLKNSSSSGMLNISSSSSINRNNLDSANNIRLGVRRGSETKF